MNEVFARAVIRIGNIGKRVRGRIKTPEQSDTVTQALALHCAYVILIHCEQQVSLKMFGAELGGDMSVPIAVGEELGARAIIGRAAYVPAGSASTHHLDRLGQPCVGQRMSQDVLSHGGPADVTGAHHTDEQFLSHRLLSLRGLLGPCSGRYARGMDPDRHGDADALPGMIDFAVNVRPGPPDFLVKALVDAVGGLAAYPRESDEQATRVALAQLHGRTPDEVLLLNGAEEGFELVAGLGRRHAVVVVPSFTEPATLLRKAGVPVTEVVAWHLGDAQIPAEADLVIGGNPTNPTSITHPVDEVLALPGLLVVDEAFADLGAASVADHRRDDLVVLRSVTKTFGLAGLRAGYLLANPVVVAQLTRRRRAWPVDSLTLAALQACASPRGQRYVAQQAAQIAQERQHLCRCLAATGFDVPVEPTAPFVLARHRHAAAIRVGLARRGIAVRSAENFTGLTAEYLRFAVRDRAVVNDLRQALDAVMEEIG